MIRSLTIAAVTVLGFVNIAQAEDEFGARFKADAPAALQPAPSEDVLQAVAPQDVEPAAGAEAATDENADAPMAVPLNAEIENKAEEEANEIESAL